MEYDPWRVDFELAVKLKEVGYPQTDDYAYCVNGTWGKMVPVNRAVNPQYPREVDLYTLGFDGNHKPIRRVHAEDTEDVIAAPTFEQVQSWLDDKGLNINIIPERYTDGINWNWQIMWYAPKEEWEERDIERGSMMYGDNGEHPTRFNAMLHAIQKALTLLDIPREII